MAPWPHLASAILPTDAWRDLGGWKASEIKFHVASFKPESRSLGIEEGGYALGVSRDVPSKSSFSAVCNFRAKNFCCLSL